MKKMVYFIFILFCSSSIIKAEVFSLGPSGGKGKGGVGIITDAMGGMKLWSEPVILNGHKTSMDLRLLNTNLTECYLTFKKYFPASVFRASPGALLIEFKHKSGALERIYLVQMDAVFPVIQFSMKFPGGLPGNSKKWFKFFPLPQNSKIETTISLPDRSVDYGTFTTSLPGDLALADVKSSLISNGWTSLKQGVFIKNTPLAIMLVSFSKDAKGVTRGFVLKRPLTK